MTDYTIKIEEYITNMPSLPATVGKVLEICNDPQTKPSDLNHVISLDPVLTARVLKLINSAYYGMETRVTSLVRAIIMLGLNTVKNLALSSAVMVNLQGNARGGGLNMDGFWRHSLCVGVCSKLLAKRQGVDPRELEEYFAGGLLHDIGKIPMNAVMGNDYMLTIAAADRERSSLHHAEEQNLGIDHCGVGAQIVGAWKLQGSVGDVICFHHNVMEYGGEHRDKLFTVAAANRLASLLEIGFSGDRYPDRTSARVWDALKINQDTLDELSPLINEEINKAEIFLKL